MSLLHNFGFDNERNECVGQLETTIQSLRQLKRIGHITPSSNTALEAITSQLNVGLANRCSHHFSRLRVTAVRLDPATEDQFALDTMVAAAELLADAPLDAIVWNGTSASWLGLQRDEELCRRISERTGLPASTSTLAFLEVFRSMGATRIGLAVPYVDEVTAKICEVYGRVGVNVVSHASLRQSVNVDIGNNSLDAIRNLLRAADSPEADCIAVVCTNLPATFLVEEMERELGKPIIDSIAVTFWKGCMLAGIDPAMRNWGALMRGELTS
ncbi:aspartate/glutamate racemase family protein [Aminobacter sp. DSM 101952]|uniref:maleate cis-trans isomerase family protein n=1 Tax=Aminobacter sp. DSM 101952 TaxID=2735891 RepID=UPI0012E35F58|nr:aspartate/glutamate racemase family protein [Aminobacter sp. DSM 101952]